jgi:hypothetical protein
MDILNYVNNQYVLAALTIFTIVYASQAQVNLPKWLVKLFKNDIFRVIYLSLLLMIPFETAPHVAIIIAIIFVVTLEFINRQEAKEDFELFEAFQTIKKY